MRCAAIVTALVVVGLLPADAQAKWTRVRSANFIFVGDASEGQIRRIARQLEQFREVMLLALPRSIATSPVPTVVMVFATDRSLNPVKPLYQGSPIDLAGYFRSGEDLNHIAINAEFGDQALITVYHEYSHFLIGNNGGTMPVWANEGLAEVYEMVQEVDGGRGARLGLAPAQHVELLKVSTLMPIRELMSVSQQSSVYNEGNRRGVFYAESWALVHYLTFGNPARTPQFRQFLSNVREGLSAQAALEGAFGADAAGLDRELFDYVRRFTFPGLQLNFRERVAADAVQRGETLDDVEGEIYLADLQSRVGREDEARARVAAILKKKPTAAGATSVLGLQELRAGRVDAALPLLEQAAKLAPTDPAIQTALGRALIVRLGEVQSDPSASAPVLEQARTVLSRAAELDPNSGFATGMLGYVELVSGTDLPRAASLLERAIALAPSREQYRLILAQVYLRQRDVRRASGILGPLMARASRAEVRDQARSLLARVADVQNQAAGAPAVAPTPAATLLTEGVGSQPPRLPGVPQPVYRPDLRPVAAGETRVLGQFRAVDCARGQVVLLVEGEGGLLRLRAKQLTDVDFISYRNDAPSGVVCGPLAAAQRVLATYRAVSSGAGADATHGDAMAIELIPDGFVP